MAGVSNGRVGIVADDLTSAADGACSFLRQGTQPRIYLGGEIGNDAQVVSVDTGSRNLSEADAAHAAALATGALAVRRLLYKTMDSTLRGHVHAEILAAFCASGRERLVIAPAFPAAGRTTIGGIQLLDGCPVSETSYGRDPVHPARTSRISDLVDPTLGPVATVPIEQDAAAFLRAAEHIQVLVLDADSQSTLNRQVSSLASTGSSFLWVGSPGLAEALSELESAAPPSPSHASVAVRRILVVVGSANMVSHAQCDELAHNGAQLVLRADDISSDSEIVCLHVSRERVADPSTVLAQLVDQAEIALTRFGFDAVIATGGETMDALLQRMSIRSFVLTTEFEPGFPAGISDPIANAMTDAGEQGQSLVLAMKAGGFGDRSSLLRATTQLLNSTASRSTEIKT